MKNQSNYNINDRIQDSEGNEFVITQIIENDHPFQDASVTLRGSGGEKEIASSDLNFFTLVKKYEPETEIEPIKYFIHGQIKWTQEDAVTFNLWKGNRTGTPKLPRRLINYQMTMTSPDTALIEVPKSLIIPFRLTAFILTDEEIEKYKQKVQEHQSLKFSTAPQKKPEKIGNVRI